LPPPAGKNPPSYKNTQYSSESKYSVVLAQNQTRGIILATDDASTNTHLIYSYAVVNPDFITDGNVTIDSFVNGTTSYGTSCTLTLTASGVISSYGYAINIYVYDTVTMETS
jgi:hypothetical protein